MNLSLEIDVSGSQHRKPQSQSMIDVSYSVEPLSILIAYFGSTVLICALLT